MNKKKALVVAHIDFDGIFSYCIVKKWLEQREDIGEIISCRFNYGNPIPEFSTIEFDEMYMVDISFPPEIMKELYRTQDIVWIDHHITAIKDSEKYGYSDMEGIRLVGTAAVELTWKYFFGNTEEPDIIQYVGAYDVWQKNRFPWDSVIVPIQLGLKSMYGINHQVVSDNFERLISDESLLNEIIKVGQIIKNYEEQQFRYAVNSYSFPVTVAGKYKGIAILTQNFGSRIFTSVLNDYDVFITINRKTDQTTGKPYFCLGMYSEPTGPDFDFVNYMRTTYGTNFAGHAKSLGGSFGEDLFNQIVLEGRL